MSDTPATPPTSESPEVVIARLRRHLTEIRAAAAPFLAIAGSLRHDGKRDGTPVTVTLGDCRDLAAAIPPE